MLKRGGRGHDPAEIEKTPKGSLTLRCPVCLIPGVNIPADWQSAPEGERWKYSFFIGLDACFKLKQKNRDIADPELGSGFMYFAKEDEYQDHLKNTVDVPEVRIFAPPTLMNSKNSTKKYTVSGVAAAKCAHHALVLPNGAADLQKGEKYVSMDFVFWMSILTMGAMSLVVVSYDIACKWSVHLWDCFATLAPQFACLLVTALRFFVPNLHVGVHGAKCRHVFGFNVNRWVGRTHGETLEQEWAHIGAMATSTREMGPGVRHGILDDHWHFWNFQKIVGMGMSLPCSTRKELMQEEGCLTSRGVNAVVVGKLGDGEPLFPVVLEVIDVQPKELFDLLVNALGLDVGLRVVSHGSGYGDPEHSAQLAHEVRHELRAAVTDRDLWKSVVLPDLVLEEPSNSQGSHL
ncbi:hypothetical protein PUNSTDRAFT_78357 [Punctularia strigosozonata HHB-11173 SS5]|uniref:Uncharacterized protein n=1 Tax=Punctularia strigosozonata (strain HHB-11173) TaxID=741275 RepID=R7RZD9_PUNST|nr:uncharacterized protein PUNSTDRAFT_78357 [Punctularia strigosozonata HHB-11173 SS5]EIN03348.1 hypothetical protein PUNSTDRAFT_78357 [Punctularia strigosozonata HHB-11173 SS5]